MPGKVKKGQNKEKESTVQQSQNQKDAKQSEQREQGQDNSYTQLEESDFVRFFMQLKILLIKNAMIFFRKKKILFFMFATPFLVSFMLHYIDSLADGMNKEGKLEKERSFQEPPISRCFPKEVKSYEPKPECVTIGYTIIGDHTEQQKVQEERIHKVMRYTSISAGLTYGVDVKPLPVQNPRQLVNYLDGHKNETLLIVNWCLDKWVDDVSLSGGKNKTGETLHLEIPCTFDSVEGQDSFFYSFMYNVTMPSSAFLKGFKKPLPGYFPLFRLEKSVKNGILRLKHEEKGLEGDPAQIAPYFRNFPYNPDRIVRKADPIQAFGSFYLVMVPLAIFIVMYDEMVREKVIGLRMGLQVIGCSSSAFWCSWMITGIVFNFFMAASMIVVGKMFDFSIFVRAPTYVLFILFFLSGLNNLAVAFLMTTLMKTQVQAYTTSFSVLLAQVIVTMVLHDAVIVYKVFFNVDMPAWVDIPRALFYFMPTFHFVKVYGDISRTVCTHFKLDQPTWVDGRPWEEEDLFLEKKGAFATKDRYHVSSIMRSFQIQTCFTLFYFLLAWYFDKVLASNSGKGEAWLFFLRPSYWLPKLEVKKGNRKASAFVERASKIDFSIDTAQEEEKFVKMLEHQKEPNAGLRIVGLGKTYTGGYFGQTSEDVHALKKLYVEVSEGELLGVMGHNGAGKSTLINLISGLVDATRGTARVGDRTVTEHLQEIRSKLGVVFQYDVLWDELTGFEHLKLFTEIKRISQTDFQRMAEERLKDVGLLKAGTLSVGQYSGGMRRRMSVALSTIGDPKVILMDEPTTGMDPVSKKAVWRLIQRCKPGRIIILTTHEMGEAEILSDKLSVLEQGELKCIGAPLQLKNIYGDGYRINLLCPTKALVGGDPPGEADHAGLAPGGRVGLDHHLQRAPRQGQADGAHLQAHPGQGQAHRRPVRGQRQGAAPTPLRNCQRRRRQPVHH